jgi:hypothetical protein
VETYPHPYAPTHTHAPTRTHTHIALRTHRLQLPIAPYVQEADAGYGDETLVSPRTRRIGRALYGLVTINLYAPFACRVCSIRLSHRHNPHAMHRVGHVTSGGVAQQNVPRERRQGRCAVRAVGAWGM